ncbi:uncharacterized protein LOC135483048 [Lineus longissimus]|uniref:uncharacterized protein LOC135483048 n=1 Tax=Lineus longissimus TaxID=88925 RepID=UPI002B4CE299
MSSDGSGPHSDRDHQESGSRHNPSESSRTSQPSSAGIINPGFSDPDRHGPGPIQTRNLPTGVSAPLSDLPDILNSTLPPYTSPEHTLTRGGQVINSRGNVRRSFGRPPRRSRQHDVHHPRDHYVLEDDLEELCDKNCCTACLTITTQFKWILVLLAIVGLCCVVTGIILGALHMTGSSFLTLSLMFIGLGVMLVIVVIIGWRCTPSGHEPCHLLFNLGEYSHVHQRRGGRHRRRSGNNTRNRLTNWSGGVIYGDHRRPPPPSYAASMQDYERQNAGRQLPNPDSLPNSPPPTYKSQASLQRPGIHITFPHIIGGEYPTSRPPTYRSHHSNVISHSRQISFESELPVSSSENPSATTDSLSSVNGAPTATGTSGSTTSSRNGANTCNGSSLPSRSILKQTNNSTPPQNEPGPMSDRHGPDSDQAEITVTQTQPEGSSPGGTLDTGSMMQYAGHYGTAERNAVECLEDILDTTMRDMNVQYQAGTLRPGSVSNKSEDVQSSNGARDNGSAAEQDRQRAGRSASATLCRSNVAVQGSSGPLEVSVDNHSRQHSGPAQTNHHSAYSSGSHVTNGSRSSQTLPRLNHHGHSNSASTDVQRSESSLNPFGTSSTLPVCGKPPVYPDSETLRMGRSRHGTSLVASVQAAAANMSPRDVHVTVEPAGQCSDPFESEQEVRTTSVVLQLAAESPMRFEKDQEGVQTCSADPAAAVISVVETDRVQDSGKPELRRERGHVRVNSNSGQSAL